MLLRLIIIYYVFCVIVVSRMKKILDSYADTTTKQINKIVFTSVLQLHYIALYEKTIVGE